MRTLGIDIGTTTISAVMVECEKREVLGKRTIAHQTFMKGHLSEAKIQNPGKIYELVKEAVQSLTEEFGQPECIGLTGQMHGMLYVDNEGNAVSPLYTWQDGCGDLLMEDGRSYAEVLRTTGGAASTGYGLVSHFYLQKNDRIPKNAVKMTTISDYIGMQLCERKEPVIAKDMAASWGCFDLENGDFLRDELKALGVDISYLPEIMEEHSVMGYIMDEKIPVIVSRGDNQASVLGAVESLKDTVLLNIGTGSQISVGTECYCDCSGSIEFRPCDKDISLLVGASLCGGRAYAMLEKFYRAVSGNEDEMYELMERQAREFLETCGLDEAWKIRTTFSGTRSNPQERGRIEGIGVDNFCPGAMTVGMIVGILDELHEMYLQMCKKTGRRAVYLAGAGNGLRKNKLMQELAETIFGMKIEISGCEEEAAFGAALYSGKAKIRKKM